MTPPECRACLANAVLAVAREVDLSKRGPLFLAAVDLQRRRGCVHLALEGTGSVAGLWAWTACGHRGDMFSACAKIEHVTCELCRAKAAKEEQ